MITVNAMGDACPIPVIKTKNAIKELKEKEEICVMVDNQIAVENLTKMANESGFPVRNEKISDNEYHVFMEASNKSAQAETVEYVACAKKNTVVAISSDKMGEGSDELGKILIKGYIFALTQLDELPDTILFYNGGAKLTTEGSASIEDLKTLEANGVEILTCGTCLNHYGIADKLMVGGVTNMYVIAEKMAKATLVVKP